MNNQYRMAPLVFPPSRRNMLSRLSIFGALLILGFFWARPANAASLTLTFSSAAGGISLGGSGTANSTISFGSVHAYGGAVPAGVTKSVGATNWTLSTPIDVKVTKTGLGSSANYTMTAQLQSSGLAYTWQLGSATLTSAFPAMVTAAGVYGSKTGYTFSLTIPFSAAAGTVNNTLDILVTAN